MTSYWLDERGEAIERRRLERAMDVAVVGGGVTGCAVARRLAEAGLAVRLYEAREIAGGASGRNGGFALRGGAMAYDEARRTLGADRAKTLWQFSEEALGRIAELAGDALERRGSLRLAVDEAEREAVRAEYEALRADGFDAEWVDELAPPLQKRYAGGLLHPADGALQPARWVRRLAALAAKAGAEVCEQSPVTSLEELDAEHVVVATDGYTQGLVRELDAAIRPTRGQVIATEPLPQRLFDRPHYARYGFDYWHQRPDRRLVIGGRRDTNLDVECTADETVTDGVQSAIDGLVRELLGFSPRVTHRWAGIWGATRDSLPLAGRLPGRDGVWVAAGYSGHGNVLGFACGDAIAGAILGQAPAELELFDPARLVGVPA